MTDLGLYLTDWIVLPNPNTPQVAAAAMVQCEVA